MKTCRTFLVISLLIILCYITCGLGETQDDKRKNAFAVQHSLELLTKNVNKINETYRSLFDEKFGLIELCNFMQIRLDEMLNLDTCINTCNSPTTTTAITTLKFKSESTSARTTSSASELTSIFASTIKRTSTLPTTQITSTYYQCSAPCIYGQCRRNGNTYTCFCYPGFGGNDCSEKTCYQAAEPGHADVTIISSPGYYLGDYPVLHNCVWNNISVLGSPFVWISFNVNFSIEQSLNCQTPNYCCDYVAIYDGPTTSEDNLIGQYCGTSPPPPFYSSTGSVSMKFYSDQSFLSKKEFHQDTATWAGFMAYIGGVNNQQDCSLECEEDQFCFQGHRGVFTCRTPCQGDMNPCQNGGICNADGFNITCTCFLANGPRCEFINHASLTDCESLWDAKLYNTSSVQTIYPNGVDAVQVYCQIETPNIWTFLQRRVDGLDFNRTWSEYEMGFGNALDGSYWVGLLYWQTMVNGMYNYRLCIDLMDCKGNKASAQYNLFNLYGENYTLSATAFNTSSIAGDSISPFGGNPVFNINGQPFSTYDKFYSVDSNCPRTYGSGWWWLQCQNAAFMSNLNGPWFANCSPPLMNSGIQWDTWKNTGYSYYNVGMKIRRSGD